MIGPDILDAAGNVAAEVDKVQRLRPFDAANVNIHELKAIVHVLLMMGMDYEEINYVLHHVAKLKMQPLRISADDPRTGDIVELGGTRVVYVNERIEINDPMTWKALCMNASPDAVYTLAGGR